MGLDPACPSARPLSCFDEGNSDIIAAEGYRSGQSRPTGSDNNDVPGQGSESRRLIDGRIGTDIKHLRFPVPDGGAFRAGRFARR